MCPQRLFNRLVRADTFTCQEGKTGTPDTRKGLWRFGGWRHRRGHILVTRHDNAPCQATSKAQRDETAKSPPIVTISQVFVQGTWPSGSGPVNYCKGAHQESRTAKAFSG